MSAGPRVFVDTNVLVYLRDARDVDKQRCTVLLTEDLSHGQELDGVRVVSPFERRPEEALR